MAKRWICRGLIAAVLVTAFSYCAFASDDMFKFKRDVLISKDMTVNDVFVVYGSVTSYGRVEGSITTIGGSVYLKDGASVKGDVTAIGGTVEKAPAVTIDGEKTEINIPKSLPFAATMLAGGWIAVWAAVSIMALLGFLGLSVLMIALIPEHMGKVVGLMESQYLKALVWGFFWTVMIVPVAVVLAISIVGIILIPLEIILVALAYILGYIAAALYIGRKVFASMKRSPPPFVDAVAGILLLFAIGWVPVAGAVVKVVFLVAGFGAVVITRFGTAG